MRLKFLAAGVMLAMTAVAPAHAFTVTTDTVTTTNSKNGKTTTPWFSLFPGSYKLGVDIFNNAMTSGFATGTVVLISKVKGSESAQKAIIALANFGNSAAASDFFSAAQGTKYKLKFTLDPTGTGTVSGNAFVTSVPGPEAGAGLAGIAAAGMGAYVLRRRKITVAA